ncbi:hypothetical protein HDV06_005746 [Boothiomyces sp. JEL0866]|nr:hypothetical protein HDV06_005746 [Boothiomyces sp. JEL0866]
MHFSMSDKTAEDSFEIFQDDEFLFGVEPWDPKQNEFILNSNEPMSHQHAIFHKSGMFKKKWKEEKKLKKKDLFDQSVLCRVARKMDKESECDTIYMHSKKIIQVEYDIDPNLFDNEQQKEESDMDLESVKPMQPLQQSIIMRHTDIEEFYNKPLVEKKKVSYPEQYQPAIPFQSKVKEPLVPNPKQQDYHPNLLKRLNNTSKNVVFCSPVSSSITEWRKQRVMATITMKQLQKIFPTAYFLKQQKRQEEQFEERHAIEELRAKTPYLNKHCLTINLEDCEQKLNGKGSGHCFPFETISEKIDDCFIAKHKIIRKNKSLPHIKSQLSNSTLVNHPYYLNPNQLCIKFNNPEKKKEQKFTKVLHKSRTSLAAAQKDPSEPDQIKIKLSEWKQNPEFARYKTNQTSFLLKPNVQKQDYSKMTVEQIKEIISKKEKLLNLPLSDGGKKVKDSIANLELLIIEKQEKQEPVDVQDDVEVLIKGMQKISLKKPNPPQNHLPAKLKKKPVEMIPLSEAKELMNTKIIISKEETIEYETDYESEYEFEGDE